MILEKNSPSLEMAEYLEYLEYTYNQYQRRIGDPDKLICDNTLAKKYLNWNIKYDNIEDHIKHTYNWIKKYNNIQ